MTIFAKLHFGRVVFLTVANFTLSLIFLIVPCLAKDKYIVPIGQSTTFKDFNYHNTTAELDPNNPLPYPEVFTQLSTNNISTCRIVATPGTAGVGKGEVGLAFDWDLKNYSWDQIKTWQVKVTIEFTYDIYAMYDPEYGSANAGVFIKDLPPQPWYEFVGYENGSPGFDKSSVEESYTLSVEELEDMNRKIILQTYCQAHVADGMGEMIHTAWAEVHIKKIKFKFINY